MATKMVKNFRRSVSFPNQPSSKPPPPRKTLHVRSTSLPCRSNPILDQLRDEISDLNSWSADASEGRTSAWLCDGLRRLKTVLESFDDLLQLPQTRESLHSDGCSDLIEKLLQEFLQFVDVYGMFQTLILRLKEEYSTAQIAVRRRDDSRIGVHSKNLKRIAKEIGKLASNFLSIVKLSSAPAGASHDDGAVLISSINDVVKVTVTVSSSMFNMLSSSTAFRKPSCVGLSFMKNSKIEGGIREFQEMNLQKLMKKSDEEVKIASKKMQVTEDCISEIEGCVESAFRSLINTRVSLLNVLTQ